GRIAEEAESRWPGARVGIEHRIGRLAVGEVSVIIVVAHPHRAEAFEACRYLIECLKQDVPIWKKEIRPDGGVWVGVGS
ncbi:MAG: molybdenum cofactor biosynthesis protein MoaE, partial [Myxococcota bacterium]